ncbi:MAG: DUF2177 family protein [Paenibacillaceae bacterium]|jgi:uncharacterized membrane protein|nr:DUF2177 family protein [Paenibacillaceae bacterium]
MSGAIKTYFITLAVFFLIDMLWLAVVAKELYRKELGFLMSDKPNLVAAVIFYLVFILGLIFFVINPALNKESWKYALLAGMLFGFITYSTYDLTNLATIKNWPLKITVIDLIWGSSLGGVVSTISFFILKK